tara:strand:+ start:185238 stop:186164 length:927 start_codon:yes stop_codon:yes gene_type:complete
LEALIIKDLYKTYSNGKYVLKGVDLAVPEGDFFALLGPNGAGKTTIINIITSLTYKTDGSIKVFGHDFDLQANLAKSFIGIVPQEFNINMFETCSNILINQAGYYGITRKEAIIRTEKYLKSVKLWDRKDDIARTLSGGMKRRLMIARALVHEPRLLILDEPTAGVDIEIRRSMWNLLREINDIGMTIILTTHYLEEAESLCRNIAIIDEGKIIENDSISNIVKKLSQQSFIFNLSNSCNKRPNIENFKVSMKSENEIEVRVSSHQNLNDVFQEFSKQGIEISSMRAKSNRLEELFISYVDAKRNDDE